MVVFYISFLSFEGWRLKTAIFHLNSPIKKNLIGSISSELFIQGNKVSKARYDILPTQDFILKKDLGIHMTDKSKKFGLVPFSSQWHILYVGQMVFFSMKEGVIEHNMTIVYIVRVKGAKSGSKENSLFSRITELNPFPFFLM